MINGSYVIKSVLIFTTTVLALTGTMKASAFTGGEVRIVSADEVEADGKTALDRFMISYNGEPIGEDHFFDIFLGTPGSPSIVISAFGWEGQGYGNQETTWSCSLRQSDNPALYEAYARAAKAFTVGSYIAVRKNVDTGQCTDLEYSWGTQLIEGNTSTPGRTEVIGEITTVCTCPCSGPESPLGAVHIDSSVVPELPTTPNPGEYLDLSELADLLDEVESDVNRATCTTYLNQSTNAKLYYSGERYEHDYQGKHVVTVDPTTGNITDEFIDITYRLIDHVSNDTYVNGCTHPTSDPTFSELRDFVYDLDMGVVPNLSISDTTGICRIEGYGADSRALN